MIDPNQNKNNDRSAQESTSESLREELQNLPARIGEVLIINKSSGLPLFSRTYSTDDQIEMDPCLVAGLMAAIVQFAQSIDDEMDLSDVGWKNGRRIFVRSEGNLICLVTVSKFEAQVMESSKLLEFISSFANRLFDSIRMLTSFSDSMGGDLEMDDEDDELIKFETLRDIDTETSNFTSFLDNVNLGPICDNIVREVCHDMDIFLNPDFKGSTRELDTEETQDKSLREKVFSIFTDEDETIDP